MKKSSVAQLELDYSSSDSLGGERQVTLDRDSDAAPAEQPVPSSAPFRVPTFNISGELHAIAARQAGRLNAASISLQEYENLLSQRQKLLDKKLDGKMTRQDEIKLDYVRWSLDRIEDAKHGAAMDTLESSVATYERFLSEVQDLKRQLWERKKGKSR